MRKNHQPQGPSNQEFPASERLDSWKEIAAYLKRDVRTVRRWERSEGLPACRHMHGRQASIYAYKPEIDAWWNNRRPRLEAQEQIQQRRGRWWVVAAVLVLGVAGTGLWWARRPALPFEERDWVLIASFENRTGEPLFDRALEHALEWELSNSRYVNVVPRERVADMLRLMRRPPDTRVDARLGREVCLRDGGIRALVTGSIEKVGRSYLLNAGIVDPGDGAMVAALTEEAENEEQIRQAVRRLSNQVRKALGEKISLIRQSEERLAQVSTPSLRALQLFSQGDLLKEDRRPQEAEPLFRQAIAEDPEFASAYTWLAHALHQQGRPKEEYLPYAEKGLELSRNATECERLFNQASYYMFTEQYEKAVSLHEALLRIHPDYFWSVVSLSWLPERIGRYDLARRYTLKRADLRPNDFWANYGAARALLTEEGETERARRYLERALALAAKEESGHLAAAARQAALELRLAGPLHYWKRGDMPRTHRAVDRLAEDLGSLSDPQGEGRAEQMLGSFYLGFGEWRRAEQLFETIPKRTLRNYALSWLAIARNDGPGYLDYRRAARPGTWGINELIYFGYVREAQWEIANLEKRDHVWQPYLDASRAMLKLRQENLLAIPALQDAIKAGWGSSSTVSFTASRFLSEFYERRGELGSAIRTLEAASEEGFLALNRPYGLSQWLCLRASLAQLYRQAGRLNEAEELEEDLRKRLIYADPDHPILRAIGAKRDLALSQIR